MSVLKFLIVGQEDKGMNNKTMHLDTKNNGAAGYLGPMKIKLRKGAGLLVPEDFHSSPTPPPPCTDTQNGLEIPGGLGGGGRG